MLASGLARSRTQTVAVMVHDVMDEYFSEIARGIEDEAYANGYVTLICNTDRDPDKELHYLRKLRAMQIDAILFAAGGLRDRRHRSEVARQLVQIEAAGGSSCGSPRMRTASPTSASPMTSGCAWPSTTSSSWGTGRSASSRGPAHLTTSTERLSSMRRALRRHGIALSDDRPPRQRVQPRGRRTGRRHVRRDGLPGDGDGRRQRPGRDRLRARATGPRARGAGRRLGGRLRRHLAVQIHRAAAHHRARSLVRARRARPASRARSPRRSTIARDPNRCHSSSPFAPVPESPRSAHGCGRDRRPLHRDVTPVYNGQALAAGGESRWQHDGVGRQRPVVRAACGR